MPKKKKAPKNTIPKKDRCERCKQKRAEYRVTELVTSKRHKPAPYQACPWCAKKALNLAGKLVTRL